MITFDVLHDKFGFEDVDLAKKKINRYLKVYPMLDIWVYAKKIKDREDLAKTKKHIINELEIDRLPEGYLKEKLYAFANDDKIASSFQKGNISPFIKIQNFIKGNQFYKTYLGDFRDSKIEAESIDLIITDPPYPKEYLNLYRDLAIYADRILKPGGSLFAMAGQSYLPQIMNLMNAEGLQYNWTLCYLTPGGQSPQIWQRKVNAFWKPILWYTKGKPTNWIGDVVKSNVNDNDKAFHFWGQSVSGMSDLILKISQPGDTILDPFMGGGTTGVACILNLRNFIGIEIEKDSFLTAEKRLADLFSQITSV